MQHRSRPVHLVAAVAVVAAGLSTRMDAPWSVGPIAEYGGDVLYATMIVLLVGALSPRSSIGGAALFGFAICVVIELTQAIQAPWLTSLRANKVVALVLGQGFVWTDFVCYAIGAGLGAWFDSLLPRLRDRRARRPARPPIGKPRSR